MCLGVSVCISSVCVLLVRDQPAADRSSNVSHVVVVHPREAGAYNISWARLTYTSDDSQEIVRVTLYSPPNFHLFLPHSPLITEWSY